MSAAVRELAAGDKKQQYSDGQPRKSGLQHTAMELQGEPDSIASNTAANHQRDKGQASHA